jgi:hypothetical protein
MLAVLKTRVESECRGKVARIGRREFSAELGVNCGEPNGPNAKIATSGAMFQACAADSKMSHKSHAPAEIRSANRQEPAELLEPH